jgi:hypothetical protein
MKTYAGVEWSTSASTAVPSGKQPPVVDRLESIWTLWSRKKSLASAGNGTLAMKPVARTNTD